MKKIFIAILCTAIVYGCGNPKPVPEEKMEMAPVDTTPKPYEIGDASLVETGKAVFAAFSEGNMDKYMTSFADDAMYRWNNGDSLAGKQAINDFWRKRRGEAIKSISYSKGIYIPVKINQSQSVEEPGNWLLVWAEVSVTYKNDKSMTQWMHWTIHFNDNKLIDRMSHFVDMEVVNAAYPSPRK